MKLKKLLLTTSVAALVSCGGSKDKDDDDIVVIDPPKVETAVSGKAIKGTISGGALKVYKYVDNEPVELSSEELATADVSTDADGNYTFTVLDYSGPIKVVVGVSTDAENPTLMICDAPDGCGSVEFGGQVNLTASAPDFSLSSVSNVDSGVAAKVNVSPLTHIATALVESSDAVSVDSISNSLTKVANTFGIQGNITELDPTDVNDNQEVASEDNESELRYGLINAGIAQSLFSGEGSITDKLASATDDLVENDGDILVVADNSGDFEFSLTGILDGASETANVIATRIAEDDSIEGGSAIADSLAQIENNLENESENQELVAGDDGRSDSESEQLTDGDAVAKAKAMVNDVRVFANLFDKDHASNGAIRTQGEALMNLIDDAEVMVQAEGDSFTLLSHVSDIVTEISMQENGDQTTFDIADYAPSEFGLTGSIVMVEDDYQLEVSAMSNEGQTLDVDIDLSLNEEGDQLKLSLMGLMTSSGASLEIGNSSYVSVDLSEAVTQAQLEEGDTEAEVVGGSINLDVMIEQKPSESVVNPVTFSGKVAADLKLIEVERLTPKYFEFDSYENDMSREYPSFDIELEQTPVPESVTLSGEFSTANGERIAATLSLDVNELATFEPTRISQGTGVKLDEHIFKVTVSENSDFVSFENNGSLFNTVSETEYLYEDLSESTTVHDRLTIKSETETSSYIDIREVQHIQITGTNGLVLNEYRTLEVEAHSNGNSSIFIKSSVSKEYDDNNDGVVDRHERRYQSVYDPTEYVGPVDTESLFDADGQISVMMDKVETEESVITGADSLGDFIEFSGVKFNPDSAFDAFKVYLGLDKGDPIYDTWVANVGIVVSDEEDLRNIEPGVTDFLVSGYIAQPVLQDAMTLVINAEDTEYSISVENGPTLTGTIDIDTEAGVEVYTETFESSYFSNTSTNTNVITSGSFQREQEQMAHYYNVHSQYSYDGQVSYQSARRYEVYGQDKNEDGEVSSDEFDVEVFYGSSFNASGQLVDQNGSLVEAGFVTELNYQNEEFVQQYGFSLKGHLDESNSASNILKRLQSVEHRYADSLKNRFMWTYIPGVGQIGEFELFNEPATSDVFAPGQTNSFNVHVVDPENKGDLESEDNYLDLAASLSVAVTLQDYDINLMLSGQRTDFEDGKFTLDLNYKTPDSDSQRSFKVMVASLDSDSIVASNAEGVVLRMSDVESDADDDSEVVIGTIKVGAKAFLAAEIVKRGSVILIKYKDEEGSTETF